MGRRPARICALALALGLCVLPPANAGASQPSERTTASKPSKRAGPKAPRRSAEPREISSTPAAATRSFALDLLRTRKGSVVISPHSIAVALAMAGKGASGLTARQIATTLHLEGPAAFDAVGRLQREIVRDQAAIGAGQPDAPTLSMANGLFLQQGFPVKSSYLSGLRRNFDAAPELADFMHDPAGAVAAINAWVSAQTNGLVPELFRSELSDWTRLVLLNAVYLDADWLHAFDPSSTSPRRFHSPSGPTTADLMHQTTSLRYGAGRGYRAVDLPYRSSTLSLLVVLPSGKDPAAFERGLTARSLARIVAGQSLQPVELSLPRFHLNTHIELNKTLASLGMPLAFSAAANFSRINGTHRLKIGEVVHEADLEVDEKGTVAAAATGVVIQAVSRPRGLVRFNANRPFLFFLRDRKSGAILFAGRFTDPASAGG